MITNEVSSEKIIDRSWRQVDNGEFRMSISDC